MTKPDKVMFRVEETSDLPIWVQLRNRMTYLIKSGQLAAGEQLPSVRSLAAEANINYNTITKAYRDLELSGLIVSVRGRGMFVQKDVCIDDSDESPIDMLLRNCIEQYRTKGMSYNEIRERLVKVVDELATQAKEAEQERQSYGSIE